MLVVPREGFGILETNRDDGADFEDFAGEGEGACGDGGGRDEGVEVQEGDLGLGEEGVGFLVVVGLDGLVELLEGGFEVLFGHSGGSASFEYSTLR